MDLSGLKWPIIIGVLVLVGWLVSAGGQSWMEKRLTSYQPGQSEEMDAANEKALSNLGGFFIKTFRYERGIRLLEICGERYPDGKNYYYNAYRCSRIHEAIADSTTNHEKQLKHYGQALTILKFMIDNNIHELDARVPEVDVLRHRAEDIAETSGIAEIGQF